AVRALALNGERARAHQAIATALRASPARAVKHLCRDPRSHTLQVLALLEQEAKSAMAQHRFREAANLWREAVNLLESRLQPHATTDVKSRTRGFLRQLVRAHILAGDASEAQAALSLISSDPLDDSEETEVAHDLTLLALWTGAANSVD